MYFSQAFLQSLSQTDSQAESQKSTQFNKKSYQQAIQMFVIAKFKNSNFFEVLRTENKE